MFYQNIDLLCMLFYSLSKDAVDISVYTLLGCEFSTYFLMFSLIQLTLREERRMNSWMLTRDAIVVMILYTLLFFWVKDDAVSWTTICMFIMFFVYLILDSSNERLMQSLYKLNGYISEDESFDAGYYEQQKRRRYSISYLTEKGFVDLEDPEYIKACKKQETLLHINYQDKPEPQRSKLINYSKIWTKLTFAITFAIRRKVLHDKHERAKILYKRVHVMNNFSARSEFDDSPVNSQMNRQSSYFKNSSVKNIKNDTISMNISGSKRSNKKISNNQGSLKNVPTPRDKDINESKFKKSSLRERTLKKNFSENYKDNNNDINSEDYENSDREQKQVNINEKNLHLKLDLDSKFDQEDSQHVDPFSDAGSVDSNNEHGNSDLNSKDRRSNKGNFLK